MPGYGLEGATGRPGERFPWSRAARLLESARNYWVCTTRPDGRPHAVPVWGIWLDGTFYFSTGRQSRKARNLAANPQVAVHLESGSEAVIVEGTVHEVEDRSSLERFIREYNSKYDWDIEPYLEGGPVYALRPSAALTFEEDLAETATRWRFEKSP